jgi:hypothetical protein
MYTNLQDFAPSSQKAKRRSFLVGLLFASGFPSILRGYDNEVIKIIGDVFLASFVAISSMAMLIFLLRERKVPFFIGSILVSFLIASLPYLGGAFFGDMFSSPTTCAYRGAQMLSVAGVIGGFFYLGKYSDRTMVVDQVATWGTLALIASSFVTLVAVVAFFSIREFGFANENALGLWLATFTLFPLALSKGGYLRWAPVLLGITAIIVTGSRTSVGAVLAGVGVYLFWKPIRSTSVLFWLLWFSIFVLAYLIIMMLTNEFGDLSEINLISREMTGKNFLSGREHLWLFAIQRIEQSPMFGYGGGSSFSGTSSEHNMYLQTLLQVGFFGLGLIIIALSFVWAEFRRTSPTEHSRAVATAAAIFIVAMMSQNFEITLLQTNLGISIPMWAMVGLGLGVGQRRN